MRKFLLALPLVLFPFAPVHAGNIANCEVVIMAQIEDGAAAVASFRDATDVISSIYDPDRPTVAVIDGHPIRGLMCTRKNPVPDAEDIPLIASGIPLVISTDFDSADAPTVTIALNEDREAVAMMAVGLSDAQQDALDALLDAYEPVEPVNTLADISEEEALAAEDAEMMANEESADEESAADAAAPLDGTEEAATEEE